MVYRRRRKERKTKEDFQREMQSLERQDEEHMRNRQQRSTSDSNAARVEESSTPRDSDSFKTSQNTHEKEKKDSKYSTPGRSRATPQTIRATTTRESKSSRHDDVGSGRKNRSKARMEFSSDDDNDSDSNDIFTPKRRFEHSKKSLPLYNGADEGSPLKKRYGNDDRDRREHSSTRKKYRRSKESSPIYETTDGEVSSIDSLDKKPPARKNMATKSKKDHRKFARSNSAFSLSSIDSPYASRDKSRRRDRTNERITKSKERRTNSREKAALSPESRAMPTEEQAPIAENDIESDSDASWNLLAKKKKRERDMTLNQVTTQETKGAVQSDEPSRGRKKSPKRRDDSDSFSEEDNNEEGTDDEIHSFHHRKQVPRYRRARNDDYGAESDKKEPKRARHSSPSRKKKAPRRDYISEDDGSVLETEDVEYQTGPLMRRFRKKELTSPTNSEKDGNSPAKLEASMKQAPTSFADNDDGFMSDCDPLSSPSPSTQRSARRKFSSKNKNDRNEYQEKRKKKPRKDRGKGQNFKQESVFDDGAIQYEKHHGGSPDDLHPQFENPKFGPFEPMEPLVLSHGEKGPLVQVPASLNRYLAPFQKEGIRFMYDCLARKSGVILGDEMVRYLLCFQCNLSLVLIAHHWLHRAVVKLCKLFRCYAPCSKRQELGKICLTFKKEMLSYATK